MNLDYEVLRLIAWALLVLALVGYALNEGISLGTSMLLPLISQSDKERQLIIASIAATAQGQQAWLVAVIAILFAAWPIAYAVSMACLQLPILLLLLAWLIRPLGFVFRDAANEQWRQYCDKALAIGGWVSTLMVGMIAGNLLKGIPFHMDNDMRILFLGDFSTLVNPFALLVAGIAICLFLSHAALFLQLNPQASFYSASKSMGYKAGLGFIVLFVLTGLWVIRLEGYHISSEILTNAASNPLMKFVKRGEDLWLDNYEHQYMVWALPSLAIISVGLGLWLSKIERNYWAFLSSSVAVTMTILTTAFTMFPFILPSNRSLNTSLTLWDASASQATLNLLVPIVAVALLLMALISRWSFRLPNHLSKTAAPKTGCSQIS